MPRYKKDNSVHLSKLDTMYKAIFSVKDKEDKAPAMRASSMPLCPNKFIYGFYNFLKLGYSELDFCKDFYCEIGTAVHSVIQKWLPLANPGVIMGNWECHHCGKWVKDESHYKGRYWKPFIVKNKVGPINCPKCNKRMEYGEFDLKFVDAPITGHTDGLLLRLDLIDNDKIISTIRDKSGIYIPEKVNKIIEKGKIEIPAYVLEYKTTSKYNAVSLKDAKLEHRCQATVYVSAMRKVLPINLNIHNIKVRGYNIQYVSRDNPQLIAKPFQKDIDNDGLYKNMCKLVNIMHKRFKNNEPKKLWEIKPCRKWPSLYPNCEYEDFCFKISAKDYKEMFKEVKNNFLRSLK